MEFDINQPLELAERLNECLEQKFEVQENIGLKDAMSLLVANGYLSTSPQFGMSEETWKRGMLILWVMEAAERGGVLREKFPYLDDRCGVQSPYPQIKFMARQIEVSAWTPRQVEEDQDERVAIISRFKKAFNSYAFDRVREKREFLQECLDDVIHYIDRIASEEELAIGRARRWASDVALPHDGQYPQLRVNYPRAHSAWGDEELEHFRSALDFGMDAMALSSMLRRTPAEVMSKKEEVTGNPGWESE